MKKGNTLQRSFRLWGENAKRLDYARNLGLNASEIVNELLEVHLRPHLEKVRAAQAQKLREVLNAPVP